MMGWLFNNNLLPYLSLHGNGTFERNCGLTISYNSGKQFSHWIDQPGSTSVLLKGKCSKPITES